MAETPLKKYKMKLEQYFNKHQPEIIVLSDIYINFYSNACTQRRAYYQASIQGKVVPFLTTHPRIKITQIVSNLAPSL